MIWKTIRKHSILRLLIKYLTTKKSKVRAIIIYSRFYSYYSCYGYSYSYSDSASYYYSLLFFLGYQGLQVNFFYSSSSMISFLDIKYREKRPYQADDIRAKLFGYIPQDALPLSNLDEFVKVFPIQYLI